jgi:hypothetical protein
LLAGAEICEDIGLDLLPDRLPDRKIDRDMSFRCRLAQKPRPEMLSEYPDLEDEDISAALSRFRTAFSNIEIFVAKCSLISIGQ